MIIRFRFLYIQRIYFCANGILNDIVFKYDDKSKIQIIFLLSSLNNAIPHVLKYINELVRPEMTYTNYFDVACSIIVWNMFPTKILYVLEIPSKRA